MNKLKELFDLMSDHPILSLLLSIFILSCLTILTQIRLVYISIGNKEINQIKEEKENKQNG